MLKISEIIEQHEDASATLTLPFDQRQKSRLRAKLDNGNDVGLVLPRGTLLRGGDCLRAEDGTVVQVQAASESVSTVFTKDSTLLARACYHLGNRHVPLQVGDSWLRYLHDHVLDELVEKMGLRILQEMAPFEPEGGAYEQGGHKHSHNDDHHHEHHH